MRAPLGGVQIGVSHHGLFNLPGLLNISQIENPTLRYGSVLLLAAAVLVVITHQYPGLEAWLTVKVLALIAYIGLGVFAFRRGKTKSARVRYLAAAIAVFCFMVSVSLTRNPLGFLSYF